MARLILSLDGQTLAEYNMTKERYTVGRLADNDIRVDNVAVSGHHSLIINILNDSFLEDLNSTNGTYVNGKLIKKHALQHDDVITVGHHQLRFVEDQIDDATQDEFEKTMVIEPSSQVEQHVARATEAARAAPIPEERPAAAAEYEPPAPAPEPTPAHDPAPAYESQPAYQPEPAYESEQPSYHPEPTYTPAAATGSTPAYEPAATYEAALAPEPEPEPEPPPAPAPVPPAAARRPEPTHVATQNIDEDHAVSLPLAKLQVLSGMFAGRELELTKALTTLGRPGIQVAAITRRAEGYYIVHVESGKPGDFPLVNGMSIGPQARTLKDNDVIQLAGVKMGFFLN